MKLLFHLKFKNKLYFQNENNSGSLVACIPSHNTTLFHAYYTDINYGTYRDGASDIVAYGDWYTTMANVRFDTKQEEEIEYHSDWLYLWLLWRELQCAKYL